MQLKKSHSQRLSAHQPKSARETQIVKSALIVAAILGLTHAAFSMYWACGGTWLISTLGTHIVRAFQPMLWALIPVAFAKAAGALTPLWLFLRAAPETSIYRVGRVISWIGAATLTLWGGLNTLVGNLVLAGFIGSTPYDRQGMIGHAWLWDPMFLIWGLCLGCALITTRGRRSVC